MPDAPRTVRAVLGWASGVLAASDTPRLDAELLLGDVLALDRAGLVRDSERVVEAAEMARFESWLEARARGRPVAQLLGRQEFWSLTLVVDEHVLVPRADTELLVELTLEAVAGVPDARIADLGTGSGAVAIALARTRPAAFVLAVERETRALRVAAHNVAQLAGSNLAPVRGDWLAALAPRAFDAICANPPYLREDDPALAHGPLAFEPRSALAAGADGLRDLAALCAGAPSRLRRGGSLLLEHGMAQGAAVRERMRAAGLGAIETRRDLAGHERVTRGRLL